MAEYVDPIVAESVRNGVAWMDEHYPGWHELITEPLVMSSPNRCVLGQVVPTDDTTTTGFHAAMQTHPDYLIHPFNGIGALGFGPTYESNMPGKQQFTLLETLWGRVVTSRSASAV